MSLSLNQPTPRLNDLLLRGGDDLSPELKGLVLRRSSDESATTVIAAQITATQNELESLRSEAEQDTRTVAAPSAGYFSGTVDGYESVLTPKRLDSLSVQDYNTLEPETIPEHTAVPEDRVSGAGNAVGEVC